MIHRRLKIEYAIGAIEPMAGERLGRTYEGFIFHAASIAAQRSRVPREVHWNPTLPSLMVQPDIIVGSESAPETIVLVTQSAARRNWQQKFWRNVGEIVDIRGVFPSGRIISIALGTEIKEELAKALAVLVDDNVFPDRDLRADVERWMARFAETASTDRQRLIAECDRALPTAPEAVRTFWKDVGARIVAAGDGPSRRWAKAGLAPVW